MSRPRLGPDFARLLSATVSSNLGDGIRLTAGPLLVASLTQDPVPVAVAVFAQQLPWLLVALPAGAWLDRLDRRRVVMLFNLARAALVGAFTLVVATGTVSLAVLYVVLFLVGLAEVVADSASSALVPTVVHDDHLPRAYARPGAAFVVSNQLVGRRWARGCSPRAPRGPWVSKQPRSSWQPCCSLGSTDGPHPSPTRRRSGRPCAGTSAKACCGSGTRTRCACWRWCWRS